jgi:hypothetical protein
MMRGTPGMRLALGIMSPLFLLLCVVAIHSEETRPWVTFQEEFNRLYAERATAKLQEAESRKDAAETARWRRVLDEVSQSRPEIAQVYLADLQVADRCTTCHRGIDNPLFQDAPQPFHTHPGNLLKQHDPNTFGCTPCHQGQGVATTTDAAHGKEPNWQAPMLPTAYLQMTCRSLHGKGMLRVPRRQRHQRPSQVLAAPERAAIEVGGSARLDVRVDQGPRTLQPRHRDAELQAHRR